MISAVTLVLTKDEVSVDRGMAGFPGPLPFSSLEQEVGILPGLAPLWEPNQSLFWGQGSGTLGP